MTIRLEPKKVALFFAGIVAFLIVAHLVGEALLQLGIRDVLAIRRYFNVDHEDTVPTVYSYSALVFCSLVLGVIAYVTRKTNGTYVVYWTALSFIFFFLAFDEVFALHERLITSTTSWTLPYGILSFVFLMAFVRFTINLPSRTRTQFVLAGLVYVVGALGFEIPAGYYYSHDADIYTVLVTIEETFEMVGVVIFIYALLSYIDAELPPVLVVIGSSEANRADGRGQAGDGDAANEVLTDQS